MPSNATISSHGNTHIRFYTVSVVLLAIISLFYTWLYANKNYAEEIYQDHTIFTVEAQQFKSELYTQQHLFYGVTEASQKVAIIAEVPGRVETIHAQEGVQLQEGAPLISLDKRDRVAILAQAEAFLGQRKLEYKAAKSLSAQKLQSRTNLAKAQAELRTAEASLFHAQQALDFTHISAPFDGIIDRIHTEIGDIANDKKELATYINLDPLYSVIYVPEKNIAEFEVGGDAVIRINTDEKYELKGTIRYIGKISDPITHAFRIEVSTPNAAHIYAEGMTVEVMLPSKSIQATRILASSLTLNNAGEIGVKLITEAGENNGKTLYSVSFQPVYVVGEDSNGMWVAGLPPTSDIITVGHGFVSIGAMVHAAL